MRVNKLFLASTSALVLTAAAAMADNNEAFLTQGGNGGHSGLIDQSDGSGNQAGASGNAIFQRSEFTGLGNTLTITQSGDDNDVGLGSVLNRGTGFFQFNQSGPGSTATVVQSSNDNVIGTVNQVARTARTTGNSLDVTQEGGDGNTITRISQDANTGAPGSRFGHSAVILQSGAGNAISNALQDGAGNDMDLEQSGDGNVIGTARQSGTSNEMDAVFTGDGNGAGSFSNSGRSFANRVGVPQGDLTQNGTNNNIDIMVTGNDTKFGIDQDGVSNSVGLITITGNNNELAILQDGDGNSVNLSDIASNFNNIGIWQYQNDNQATVDIAADSSSNEFGIYQDGMTNDASVSISGGRDNGIGNPFVNLAGPALTVSGVSGWERGMVKQLGDLNMASLTVDGQDNEFGTLQDGIDNELTTSQSGNGHTVAISQVGNMNVASAMQSGGGNNAGIMQ